MTLTLTFSFLVFVLLTGHVRCRGRKDYGDDCDPRLMDARGEERKCDSDKGLYCHPDRRECICYVSGVYYQQGSCRARISQDCGISDGFRVDCVKRGFCNATVSQCQCYKGMEHNYERTACNAGQRLKYSWFGLIFVCMFYISNYSN